MFSDELLKEAKDIWEKFLPHEFLKGIARNELPQEAFNKWMVNDYHFAKNSLRFMALLMAKAPDDLLPFFAESIYFISKELEMFEGKADELGIKLGEGIDWRAKAYVNYLLNVASLGSLLEGFTAFYCEEKAYYETWSWVRRNQKGKSRYQEFIDRWSSGEFGEYVARLEEILNQLAEKCGEFEREKAREVFLEVSRFELLFWEIGSV